LEFIHLKTVKDTNSLRFTWSKQKWLFGGPAFIQPIRATWKVIKKLWLAEKSRPSKKGTFVL